VQKKLKKKKLCQNVILWVLATSKDGRAHSVMVPILNVFIFLVDFLVYKHVTVLHSLS
jgi:hypothetical protein